MHAFHRMYAEVMNCSAGILPAVARASRPRSGGRMPSGQPADAGATLKRSSLMSSLTLLQSLHESLSTRAQVTSVFGEPIIAGDKTIIPVAKIAYGFGGGTGSGGLEIKTARGEGGGGGGGVGGSSRGRLRGRSAGNSLRRGGGQEEAAGHVVAGRGAGLALRAAQEKVEFGAARAGRARLSSCPSKSGVPRVSSLRGALQI